MNLVIFDIDGTLMETMKADEECFLQALADVCGFDEVDTDWSRYRHATDSGIFHEIHETLAGRSPSDAEVSHFRQHFLDLLARNSSEAPFAAVPGAPRLLSQLAAHAKYRVALATGAWRDSARLKMASAGMSYEDFPSASADDAHDRESIVKLSMKRAAVRFGEFRSAVYVGDGIWDARTCRKLGIPFVAIATGEPADRRIAEGAVCVFPDFSDAETFMRAVTRISCPGYTLTHQPRAFGMERRSRSRQ